MKIKHPWNDDPVFDGGLDFFHASVFIDWFEHGMTNDSFWKITSIKTGENLKSSREKNQIKKCSSTASIEYMIS